MLVPSGCPCEVFFNMFKIVKFLDGSLETPINMVPTDWEDSDMCFVPGKYVGSERERTVLRPCKVLRRGIKSLDEGKMILDVMQTELDNQRHLMKHEEHVLQRLDSITLSLSELSRRMEHVERILVGQFGPNYVRKIYFLLTESLKKSFKMVSLAFHNKTGFCSKFSFNCFTRKPDSLLLTAM